MERPCMSLRPLLLRLRRRMSAVLALRRGATPGARRGRAGPCPSGSRSTGGSWIRPACRSPARASPPRRRGARPSPRPSPSRMPTASSSSSSPPAGYALRVERGRLRGNGAAREPHAGRPPRPSTSSCRRESSESITVRAENGYQVPAITQRHEDADAAARRAAVGHRRHPPADAGPADDQRRRRRALRARRHPPSGGEQPRPGHHPRQQLLGRFLRRRRPRRRPVLPRPVQPRSRRGPEGAERHDLRARRRRRRDQPRDQGGRVRRRCGKSTCRAAPTPTSASPRISTSRSSEKLALRLNGLYEDSGSFRDGVDLQRSGIAPTLTFMPGEATKITLGYEHFRDTRVADRGITSFQGRPADVDIDTFYGNPDDSHVRALVNLALRRRRASLRRADPPQPDALRRLRPLLSELRAGRGHGGQEPGHPHRLQQRHAAPEPVQSDRPDLRAGAPERSATRCWPAPKSDGSSPTTSATPGFFNNTATSILVPYGNPTINTPVTFRQSATDADNHLRTEVAALYAQDQIELSAHLQLVAGLRFDRFDLQYHNNRNGDRLGRVDDLVSPRAGIIVKPIAALSLYGTYSVSYLPSSGDQFSSLTTITAAGRSRRNSTTTRSAPSGTPRTASPSPPPSTGWTARTPGRPIPTIRPGSSRPAASAPTATRSASTGRSRRPGASPAAMPIRTPS